MNKGELIESVHHHLQKRQASKALAAEAVEGVLAAIHHSLSHGGHVNLVGFGSFTISKRAARNGRNPQTGEELKIGASNTVRFKPGAALKGAVNGKAASKTGRK